MLCNLCFHFLKPVHLAWAEELNIHGAISDLQTHYANVIKFLLETIRILSIAFVGNWATLQSRIASVDSSTLHCF